MPVALPNNRTLQILAAAEKGGYGILAQVCYDPNSALALVRAAEKAKSPAILQLFYVSLKTYGIEFLRFCVNIAHSASVPISVHMDHATSAEQLELALSFAEQGVAFDSIMVDASHADTDDENIAIARPYIERCVKLGIATEVELGRLEGGEAGVREVSGNVFTDPSKAERFMNETGAHILAPCVGNRHGSYKKIGPPEELWDMKLLETLSEQFKGRIPTCAHGTDELPEQMWQAIIRTGVSKINVNSWIRDPYADHLADALKKGTPLPEAIDGAIEVNERECERFFKLLGSAGKA